MMHTVQVVLVKAIPYYPARFLPLWMLWAVLSTRTAATVNHDGSSSSGNGGGGGGDAD
jgi:hypothetical protein